MAMYLMALVVALLVGVLIFLTILVGLCSLPSRRARLRAGAATIALGVLGLLVVVGWNWLHYQRSELRTVSADGQNVVWLQHTWSNRTEIRWRSPHGNGGLYVGATRKVIISPSDWIMPRGFVWFATPDRFFIDWGSSYGGRMGVVVEVSTGEGRMPTPEEATWLLEEDELDDRGKRFLWYIVTDWCEYERPDELEPPPPAPRTDTSAGPDA